MSKANKLKTAAASAAEVRAYQTDPDVVALRVERVRGWVDRLVWSGIIAGLLFTMANVQHFAAQGTKPPWQHGGSIEWVIAWLLDPMVSLVLIGVLMGEQVINRYQLGAGAWVRRTKWVALTATYAMNTWSAWSQRDPATILLHSVPPVIVVCAAEAITTLRHQISEAVNVAYRLAADRNTAIEQARTDDRAGRVESAPRTRPLRTHTTHADAAADRSTSAHADTSGRPTRDADDPARGNGGAPLDRAALVSELADQIRDAVHAGEQWRPDYPGLMARSGFRRRWCEEVVRDAKHAVLSADDGADSAQALDVRAPLRAEDSDPENTGEHADSPASDADADERPHLTIVDPRTVGTPAGSER